MPRFTLVLVTTRDGFIARYPGHSPADWASPEEQAVFFEEVGQADWGIMGRGTHEGADRPDRRRIVFSTSAMSPEWRRPGQLWLDPSKVGPAELTDFVAVHHPLRSGLILGGTRVHDWFRDHDAIDSVLLSVEPIAFGSGLPIFSDQQINDPEQTLSEAGFVAVQETRLNAGGTRLIRWDKGS